MQVYLVFIYKIGLDCCFMGRAFSREEKSCCMIAVLYVSKLTDVSVIYLQRNSIILVIATNQRSVKAADVKSTAAKFVNGLL